MEAEGGGFRCGPPIPARCGAQLGHFAWFSGGAEARARDRARGTHDDSSIGEAIVRRALPPTEAEGSARSSDAVHGDSVLRTGNGREADPARGGRSVVVVAGNLGQRVDRGSGVHPEYRVERRSIHPHGQRAGSLGRPAKPDRGSSGVAGVRRLAGLLRRILAGRGDLSVLPGNELRGDEIVVRRRCSKRPRCQDEHGDESRPDESKTVSTGELARHLAPS
jgi:hypothetical protein